VSDPGILLVAELHARAGLVEQLQGALAELADGARTEPECVNYRVLAAAEPAEYVLMGAWRSEAGLQAHYDTPHYRHYRDQVGPLLARPSDVVVHHVSETVHARDPNPPDPGMLG
jgi:quinol monooxygenase YgiN